MAIETKPAAEKKHPSRPHLDRAYLLLPNIYRPVFTTINNLEGAKKHTTDVEQFSVLPEVFEALLGSSQNVGILPDLISYDDQSYTEFSKKRIMELRNLLSLITAYEYKIRDRKYNLKGIFTTPKDGKKFKTIYNTLKNKSARYREIFYLHEIYQALSIQVQVIDEYGRQRANEVIGTLSQLTDMLDGAELQTVTEIATAAMQKGGLSTNLEALRNELDTLANQLLETGALKTPHGFKLRMQASDPSYNILLQTSGILQDAVIPYLKDLLAQHQKANPEFNAETNFLAIMDIVDNSNLGWGDKNIDWNTLFNVNSMEESQVNVLNATKEFLANISFYVLDENYIESNKLNGYQITAELLNELNIQLEGLRCAESSNLTSHDKTIKQMTNKLEQLSSSILANRDKQNSAKHSSILLKSNSQLHANHHSVEGAVLAVDFILQDYRTKLARKEKISEKGFFYRLALRFNENKAAFKMQVANEVGYQINTLMTSYKQTHNPEHLFQLQSLMQTKMVEVEHKDNENILRRYILGSGNLYHELERSIKVIENLIQKNPNLQRARNEALLTERGDLGRENSLELEALIGDSAFSNQNQSLQILHEVNDSIAEAREVIEGFLNDIEEEIADEDKETLTQWLEHFADLKNRLTDTQLSHDSVPFKLCRSEITFLELSVRLCLAESDEERSNVSEQLTESLEQLNNFTEEEKQRHAEITATFDRLGLIVPTMTPSQQNPF